MLNKTETKIVQNNQSLLQQYQANKTTLGVVQFDRTTGKKLNTFKNRYQAASWIVANGLTAYRYRGIGQTRCCIAGALTAALAKGPYAYGYMWKYVIDPKNTVNMKRLPTGLSVDPSVLVSIYDKKGKRKDYASIKDACIANGITNRMRSETLKSHCNKKNLIVYIREKVKTIKNGKRHIQ